MSGDITAIIGALIAAPVVIAGVALVGAIKVIGFLAGTAYDAYNAAKAKKAIKVDKMSAETAALFADYQKTEAQQIEKLKAVGDTVKKKCKEEKEQLESVLKAGETAVTAFKEKAEARVSEVIREMNEMTEIAMNEAEKESRKAAEKATALSEEIKGTLANIKNMRATEQQKQTQMRSIANTAISDAEAILEQIKNTSVSTVFRTNLNGAIGHFNNQNYALAYTEAKNLVLQGASELIDEDLAARRAAVRHANLENRVDAVYKEYDTLENATIAYKGDNYTDDLTRYYPEFFKAICNTLECVKKELKENPEPDTAAYRRLSGRIADAQDDLRLLREKAVQRMYASEQEKEAADKVIEALEGQNFTFEDFAYEEGIEGQKAHLNFKNEGTGETITVVLDPESEEDNLGIRLLQYGSDKNPIDAARMKSNEDLVMKALRCTRHVCTKVGKLADDKTQRNLERTQAQRAQGATPKAVTNLKGQLKCV